MEQLKVSGQVFRVSEKIVKSEKFTFKNLWLTHGDKYPQTIEIQFNNDKCELLNNVKQGDVVTVGINLNGRLWNGQDGQKVFNTINGWSIELSGQPKHEPQTQPYQERVMQNTSQKIEQAMQDMGMNDDLPF
jgi:hypothetical protein